MKNFSKGQWIEAAFLAPATFTLVSGLPFGIVFTALTLAVGLAVGMFGGQAKFIAVLRDSRPLIALLLMMVAPQPR